METKDFTPWPITVGHVRIVSSDYVRNNQTVKTTTYLVYLKKDPFDTKRSAVIPLYAGEHDALIEFYEGAKEEADGDEKLITGKAIEDLITKRAEKWATMTEIQKKMAAKIISPDWPETEDKQKALGEKWAMLPLEWNTGDAWKENPPEGSMGMIFGNLPIGDGTEKFYVIDKEGKEITRTQSARAGQRVTQTHADVTALVKRHGTAWIPLNGGATMEEALRIELQEQLQRDRFRKAESTAEVLARLAAAAAPAAEEAKTPEPPVETPAEATAPATETPATATTPTAQAKTPRAVERRALRAFRNIQTYL